MLGRRNSLPTNVGLSMNESEMNKLPDESIKPEIPAGPLTPGATLRQGREERGWTIEQVAGQLYLAPRQVVALENDDYASLPGMSIVRGFMRSYAKLLKIDPAPLLASVGSETRLGEEPLPARKSLSTPFSQTRMPSMNDKPAVSSKWVLGVLIVVLAGVGIWAAQQNSDVANLSKSASDQVRDGLASLSGSDASRSASQADASGSAKSAGTGVESPAAPSAPAPSSLSSTDSTASPAVAPNTSAQPSQGAPGAESQKPATDASAVPPAVSRTTNTTSAPAPVSATPAPATPETAKPAAPASNPLVFNVRDDSWITVKRADDNSTVFTRLVKAGETETIDLPGPVTVVIGNAAGVSATLRGAPVNLKPGNGNVARLSLK
jgi:cytoskeleton protein RodZ